MNKTYSKDERGYISVNHFFKIPINRNALDNNTLRTEPIKRQPFELYI